MKSLSEYRIKWLKKDIEKSRALMAESLEDMRDKGADAGHEYAFKCGQLESQMSILIHSAEKAIESFQEENDVA